MKEFHEIVKDTDAVHDAMKKLDPDFGGLSLGRHESLALELLRKLTGDTSANSWISYYIYELDWGKKPLGEVVVRSKRWAKLGSIEKLFDIITHDNATSNE